MNALAALLIWLLTSLGLPADGLTEPDPNCNVDNYSASGDSCDSTDDSDLILQRFPRIYNGF